LLLLLEKSFRLPKIGSSFPFKLALPLLVERVSSEEEEEEEEKEEDEEEEAEE
jgi:hypothetical protein